MSIVYMLQNGQNLNESHFCKYLMKKISKTAKKQSIKFIIEKQNKVYCLDDAAIDIIYGLMKDEKMRLKKSAFLFCLRKELEIYGRLRKVNFRFAEYIGLKRQIKEMLDEMENKHREIKYSIVKAFFQIQEL